jgi:hypothetical protein
MAIGDEITVITVEAEPVSVIITEMEMVQILTVIEQGPQGRPGGPGTPGLSGSSGAPGPPGGVGLIIDEDLTGVVNNINKVFTTSTSYLTGSVRVYVNGLRQRNGTDFTETGDKEITMDEAPNISGFADHLSVTYIGA